MSKKPRTPLEYPRKGDEQMSDEKYKYNLGWDLSEKDPLKKALWALSQYRQMCVHLSKDKNMTEMVPEDMGTDEGGSWVGFDWLMILEFESRELLTEYGVKFEERIEASK